MKALLLREDKTLTLTELDRPQPGPNEVIIAVKASALNHREIWIQKALYPGMKLPCILGADGAGVVVERGTDVSDDWLNEEVIIYPAYDWGEKEQAPSRQFRVLGMPDPGTISEFIKVPVTSLVKKPPYLTWEEAAALPIAGLTSWRGLVRHGKIEKGSKVLITGIGGGVAQAGLSLAKAFGAEVYVTSSKPVKIAQAIEIGASGGVNYKDKDWHLQMKTLSNGIDIVLDSSPSPVLDNYYKFMNYGGRIVTYGSTGSPKTTISISKFFLRHIHFIGTAMGSPTEFQELITFMEKHQIRPVIHQTFPMDKAIEAIKTLEQGQQIGKIVLIH